MEGAGILLFMLAFTAMVVYLAVSGRKERQRIARQLDAFRDGLQHGVGRTELRWSEELVHAWVGGRLRDHEVRLSFERRGFGRSSYIVAQYTVAVDNPAGDFEVGKTGFWEELGAFIGIVRPVGVPNTGLVVRDGDVDGVFELFRRDELAGAMRALQGRGVEGLALRGGKLRAERRVDDSTLEPANLRVTFGHLIDVARACQRRKVTITVKDAAPVSRFVWTGGGAASLCPYCRDDVQPDGADAAACEACQTVHHRACLDEAGGCTVFGCSRARARGRDRAT